MDANERIKTLCFMHFPRCRGREGPPVEKNDADLRFAFGVTAMTTDRNASRQVAVKSALKFSIWIISLSLSY